MKRNGFLSVHVSVNCHICICKSVIACKLNAYCQDLISVLRNCCQGLRVLLCASIRQECTYIFFLRALPKIGAYLDISDMEGQWSTDLHCICIEFKSLRT